MSLRYRRAERVFDALVDAGSTGMTTSEVFDDLVGHGLAISGQSHQLIGHTISTLRGLLASDGASTSTEVVTCDKAAHNSRYRLAAAPATALAYRTRRAGEIANEVGHLIQQIETEQHRFAGHRVFSDAATDYLRSAVRELNRGASLTTV